MMKARLFDIQRSSYVDGPGIRTVVFFKGCNLRCMWCHNPESQSVKKELMLYSDICTHCGICEKVCPHAFDRASCVTCGKCVEVCLASARKLCGYELDTDEIMKIIRKDIRYYKKSGGGVTFSGGECLLQPEPLMELVKLCRAEGIETAIDTAGNVSRELIQNFAETADIFLFDVKAMDSDRHREGTGAGNELILSNLSYLLDEYPEKVIIRVPVITGFNDDIENFIKLRSFIGDRTPRGIELLPYHKLGESKYSALGKHGDIYAIPSDSHMAELQKIMR